MALQTKGGEVVAAYILTTQRFGFPICFATPHAELRSAGLKGGHLLELRGGYLKTLVQLVGKHAPTLILWTTLHTASRCHHQCDRGWRDRPPAAT